MIAMPSVRTFLRTGTLATLLSTFLSLTACASFQALGDRYDVPELDSVKEQYEFAEKQAARYSSPLGHKSRVESAGKAIAAYRKVVEIYPDEKFYVGRSRLGIATIQDGQGRSRQALRDYEMLLEEYPEDERLQAISLQGAARLSDARGDIEKAKSYYRQILDRWSASNDTFFKTIALRAKYAYRKVRER